MLLNPHTWRLPNWPAGLTWPAISGSACLPRSLRGQFTLALTVLSLLMAAGGLASVYALRTSSHATEQLAQEHLVRMQEAQEMVQRTLLLERETERLLTTPSLPALQLSYAAIVQQTAALDLVVAGLAQANDDIAVLDLHQANQLFRNTANVVAQLRESALQTDRTFTQLLQDRARELRASPGVDAPSLALLLYRLQGADSTADVDQLQTEFVRRAATAFVPDARDPFAVRRKLIDDRALLGQFHDQLAHQAESMVAVARQRSASLDGDYRAAVRQLVDTSLRHQHWVLLLLASSLLFTWLVSGVFRRHVLRRLQHVSRYLLQHGAGSTPLEVLVHGHDEIGDMARAVDRFLADRAQLDLRTTELQEAQAQLLAAARLAGMAEIATNVLHNVGNVLNSVNVSAGLVSARLRNSKLKGLARAVQLMDEHPDDLGEFLTHDARGKLLPGYLRELAQALEGEHVAMAEELGVLGKSIDHIKEVVATQQSYAGASHFVEFLKLDELLEDALRMNAGALTRHKVEVVKNIAELPALPLDRHRLLQILVNLISNAKHAMNGVSDRSPRITLGAALVEVADRRVLRITVADNGEGIAPENLVRVFAHGFTTRKNGHGFGLHSCVLAAHEMGGTLIACSDGLGRGATFVLDIPIDPSKGRQ